MQRLQIKKLFFWFAFVVLGFFSCYWTADSLYIWQPVLGLLGSWLLALLFYIMASLCFTLLLNAFDKRHDFYGKFLNRGASLLLGLLGLIVFWLICSMPTNTHTLLYNAEARNTLSQDFSTTIDYLGNLENNNTAIKNIEADYQSKANQVELIFAKMIAEMDDQSNKGIGIRFNTLVHELKNVLDGINDTSVNGQSSIQQVKHPGSTRTQWLATLYQYREQANRVLRIYRNKCDDRIADVRKQMQSDRLKALIKDCKTGRREIENMNGVDNQVIDVASRDLIDAYTHIRDNARYLTFKNSEDSARYCAPNPHPMIKSLQVVPQVWKDYITTDKYDGYGFIWWVLISVLVDIAGFVFFYLANKED